MGYGKELLDLAAFVSVNDDIPNIDPTLLREIKNW